MVADGQLAVAVDSRPAVLALPGCDGHYVAEDPFDELLKAVRRMTGSG
jgi:hypothetical protein